MPLGPVGRRGALKKLSLYCDCPAWPVPFSFVPTNTPLYNPQIRIFTTASLNISPVLLFLSSCPFVFLFLFILLFTSFFPFLLKTKLLLPLSKNCVGPGSGKKKISCPRWFGSGLGAFAKKVCSRGAHSSSPSVSGGSGLASAARKKGPGARAAAVRRLPKAARSGGGICVY